MKRLVSVCRNPVAVALGLAVALAVTALPSPVNAAHHEKKWSVEKPPSEKDVPFKPLFDGKTLDGWVQRGGKAKYAVKDGAILGTSVPNTPNSFLCTKKDYADFVLEFEFKVHPELNSGVQIRSTVYDKNTTVEVEGKKKKFGAGRVHGYQCEIDPSPGRKRWWTAGIYDEGRRGWLYPGSKGGNGKKFTEQGGKVFKQEEWNKVRIVAIGDRIRTYLNGELRADLKDGVTPKGLIGLQVHGVGKRKDPVWVMWRNIRIQDLGYIGETEKNDKAKTKKSDKKGAARQNDHAAVFVNAEVIDQAKDDAKRDDWQVLFDGSNLDAWQTGKGEEVKQGWVIKEGTLYRASRGGDIFTRKEFADFEFVFEWKVAAGSNSGVKYRFTSYSGKKNGPEYQVLDDDKHPDAKKGDGDRKAACLYDIMKAKTEGVLAEVGKWNTSKIIAKGSKVEHWLNGKKVLAYDSSSDAYKALVQKSKFKGFKPLYGSLGKGRIMLQDHSDPVWYRNLKIREIK